MATGRSGQVDSPGGALTAPANTDNYAPGGFSGGTTPADTGTAAAGAGPGGTRPFDGYSDSAKIGAGLARALGDNQAGTFKG
jgi:hypothetical protein